MGAVSAQKKPKQKKFTKRNRRKKTQHLRKERALHQVKELHQLILKTTDLELKRSYIKHIRALAQKVQLNLPPIVKYSFCRRCSEVFTLYPIKTFSVRLKSKPQSMMVYTCLKCGYRRKKLYKKQEKAHSEEKDIVNIKK